MRPRPPPADALPRRPLAPLIGRDRELREVEALLATPEARLVTLVGPPGVGKTRLALEVAHRRRMARPDGVQYVALNRLAAGRGAQQQIARLIERWAGALRPSLLILDAFEYMLPAAVRLAAVVERRASLCVLVTSRSRLRVSNERVVALPPLAPVRGAVASRMAEYVLGLPPAARLFVARTRSVNPAFSLEPDTVELVAEICDRLDGLPLAIEHAALATTTLSLHEILRRLRAGLEVGGDDVSDRPRRERSIWQSAAWSVVRSPAAARTVFHRLGVFEGSFSLEAAAAVAGIGEPRAEVVRAAVASLADRSLLLRAGDGGVEDAPRFRMLAPIRGYALGRLSAADVAALRRVHAQFYGGLAEAGAAGMLLKVGRAQWLTRLAQEGDNFRAALRWAVEAGNSSAAARLSAALRWWWRMRPTEAPREVVPADLMRVLEPEPDGRRRAAATLGAAALALSGEDAGAAHRLFEVGLARAAEQDDRALMAEAHEGLGDVRLLLGEPASEYFQRSRALFAELRDGRGVGAAERGLGLAVLRDGDFSGAQVRFESSLALARTAHDLAGAAEALLGLGVCALRVGDLVGAEHALAESETLLKEGGAETSLALVQTVLGLLMLERGSLQEARLLLVSGLLAMRRLGDPAGTGFALDALAALAADGGQPGAAVRLSTAAQRVGSGGAPIRAACRALVEARVEKAARQLAQTGAAAARTAGELLPVERAVSDALTLGLNAALPSGSPSHPEAAPVNGYGASSAPALAALAGLTGREQDIAWRVAQGLTNRQIAADLGIAERTVDTHVEHILKKLRVRSRALVAAWATQVGLRPPKSLGNQRDAEKVGRRAQKR